MFIWDLNACYGMSSWVSTPSWFDFLVSVPVSRHWGWNHRLGWVDLVPINWFVGYFQRSNTPWELINLNTCAKGNQHTTHKRIRYVIRMGLCVGHLHVRGLVWKWKQMSCHGVILFATIIKLCSRKLEGLPCKATSWDTTPSFWLQKTFHLHTPK